MSKSRTVSGRHIDLLKEWASNRSTRAFVDMLYFTEICIYYRSRGVGFTEPNRISARAGVAVPAGNRFGSVMSGQKYPWLPRNVWSGVSGTGNPNMKLVLV